MKRLLGAILATAILTACAPDMRMGQPIYDRARNAFFSELSYGKDGFAVVYFRTPELAEQFAQLRGVEIVMRAAPIRTARSEVVVSDGEATR